MPKLEGVLRAMEAKKAREASSELLEEIRLVGTAIELQDTMRQLAQVTRGLEARIDKMQDDLTSVSKLTIPDHSGALSDIKGDFSGLRAELVEALSLLAKGINDTQKGFKSIEFPAYPEQKEADFSSIHDEFDRMYRVLSEIRVESVSRETEHEEKEKKRNFTWDIKRNQSGFIKTVECREL